VDLCIRRTEPGNWIAIGSLAIDGQENIKHPHHVFGVEPLTTRAPT